MNRKSITSVVAIHLSALAVAICAGFAHISKPVRVLQRSNPAPQMTSQVTSQVPTQVPATQARLETHRN